MDKIRWGIAATGQIASQFAQGLGEIDDAVISAVGSRSQASADAFADRFDIPNRHDTYERLAADPEVDIVYVASPQSRHEADTLMFLEAGKHVLCEKPLALNAEQVERMAATADHQGVFLMEAIWSRFLPSYQVLAKLLADGRIGTPLVVEADFGFRMPIQPEHRLFDLALGGGSLLDLGIYPVQLCSLVFGTPDRVAAVGHIGETGVDEQVAAVLHHPGGGIGVIKSAIRVPLSCTARISGSEGWIELPAMMHCPTSLTIGGPAGRDVQEFPYEGEGLRFQVPEVHRCLREGLHESPVMPLSESVNIARTLDEIRGQIGLSYPTE